MKKSYSIFILFVLLINPVVANDSLITVILNLQVSDSIEFDSIYKNTSKYTGINLKKAKLIADTLNYQCRKINYTRGFLFTLIRQSDVQKFSGNYEKAIELNQQILQHPEINNYSEIEARANAMLGSIYHVLGNLGQSLTYLFKSLETAESMQINDLKAYNYNNLGLIYKEKNEYKKSINYHLKSSEIHLMDGNKRSAGTTLANAGGTYHKKGEIDSAIYYYKKAKQLYVMENYISGLAGIANNIGVLYRQECENDSALKHFYIALKYDKDVGTQYYLCSDYINIGEVYISLKKYNKAIEALNEGLKIANELKLHKRKYKIHKMLANVYKELDMFEQSTEQFELSLVEKDSVVTIANEKMAKEIETKYEIAEKEAENKMLLKEQQISKQKIKYQRIVGVLLVHILFAVLIFLYFIHKSNKKNKVLNNQLLKANRELAKISRTKDKFFSIISHDLKGPMGSLKGLTSKLMESGQNNETNDKTQLYLSVFRDEITNTYNLLDNLLTWSRSQFNQIKFSPEEINLKELVENIQLYLKPLAKSKSITIENLIPKRISIKADKNLLTTIIRNLISNAIKYSHENSEIHVIASSNEDKVTICVEDFGVGIDKLNLNSLFYLGKVDSLPGTKNEKGTGLGLILCKEFVDMHNGDIWVESDPGKGSRFYVSL